MGKRIVIGSDAAAFALKDNIIEYLESLGHEVTDVGKKTRDDGLTYVDAGIYVAKAVQSGEYDAAIGLCGTGMGISQVLNSFKGVKAALVESKYTARRSREINDANVLVMGGFVVTPQIAREMVDEFLGTEFLSGFEGPLKEELDREMKRVETLGQE
ncbi:MAG: RpiB/LacA/LacB family sugar-phosphate isomerase [Christensenellales bacterium]|jgi:ribose 5-phosphate isomerase B